MQYMGLIMSIKFESKFLSTAHICVYFDVSKDFIQDKKNDGTFKNGIHYAQPVVKMLRWNVEELEKWFGFMVPASNTTTDALVETKVIIDNFLK